jgi:acetyl-CoA/propionyl-CoA carboxylase carboxyl transferase subunit
VTDVQASGAAVRSRAATTGLKDDPRDPRARLAELLDEGSLVPLAAGAASGVVAGLGRVDGVPVVAFAIDPRVDGGALSHAGCTVITTAYAAAVRDRAPVIGVWHSSGASLREGVDSLDGVGSVFLAMTRASGVIPQLSVVLGPAAGGAAYGPALTDLVILSGQGRIFVTGPGVVRSVTGEDVDMAALGGPEPHSRRSGVAHVVTATDAEAMAQVRRLTALLGRPGTVALDRLRDVPFEGLLPPSPRRAYDMHPLLDRILDQPPAAAGPAGRESVELHPKWAPNIVTMLGRLGGATIGVIANNPLRLAGCLDSLSAEKAARFVRMCDSLGVPLVVVVDVPGYLPGVSQEREGVVRRGAKLLHAFGEATVPRVTLVVRKAYGGAYIAMNSRALGATRVLAWPGAEIAVMGALPAVRILHRRKIAEAPAEEQEQLEASLADEHARTSRGLDRACETGAVDEVIAPGATRSAIAVALVQAAPGRGAHGNIPL